MRNSYLVKPQPVSSLLPFYTIKAISAITTPAPGGQFKEQQDGKDYQQRAHKCLLLIGNKLTSHFVFDGYSITDIF
jgi:hypothetical protein